MSGQNTVVQQVALVLGTVTPALTVLQYAPLLAPPETLPYPIAWVETIGELREYRRGYGGAVNMGRKWVEHPIVISVRNTSISADLGEPAFRDLIDQIRSVLRANQSLGGTVLRFAEDLQVTIHPPEASGTIIWYAAEISSTALEEIVG
jgi:hypothetical protein